MHLAIAATRSLPVNILSNSLSLSALLLLRPLGDEAWGDGFVDESRLKRSTFTVLFEAFGLVRQFHVVSLRLFWATVSLCNKANDTWSIYIVRFSSEILYRGKGKGVHRFFHRIRPGTLGPFASRLQKKTSSQLRAAAILDPQTDATSGFHGREAFVDNSISWRVAILVVPLQVVGSFCLDLVVKWRRRRCPSPESDGFLGRCASPDLVWSRPGFWRCKYWMSRHTFTTTR